MPCYSSIQTQLIDLAAIERAAQAQGIKVTRHSQNHLTLCKGDAYIDIDREKVGDKFSTVAFSGDGNYIREILHPLTHGYAKEQLKAFAKKNGYVLSAGKKPGEYELVSLKG